MQPRAMSVFVAGALLVVGSGPAVAKPKPKPKPRTSRTVEFRYRSPAVVSVGVGGPNQVYTGCYLWDPGCFPAIRLAKDERYIEMTIVDDSGYPAAVAWVLTLSSRKASYGVACSPAMLRVPATVEPVSLDVGAASRVPDCAVATSGKVTVRIRNFP